MEVTNEQLETLNGLLAELKQNNELLKTIIGTNWRRTVCEECESRPVYAKGLCRNCYNRRRYEAFRANSEKDVQEERVYEKITGESAS